MSSDIQLSVEERIQKFKDDDYLSRGPFSGKNHLVYQIDSPALKVATYHDRIMGFWVITWMHLVKEELRTFFENGGHMRLIMSQAAKSHMMH